MMRKSFETQTHLVNLGFNARPAFRWQFEKG
jgi:hypothetical protein